MRLRIIFITGTDTGVGKTVVTSLLLCHLRRHGCDAIALKPFCSGGRADARLLYDLQDGELTLDQINPFHFSQPLAPLMAARLQRRRIPMRDVLDHIRSAARVPPTRELKAKNSKLKAPVLLIEGAGGLLSPLGEPSSASRFKVQTGDVYTALDLISALSCEVIVVASNRLGTINHTLLTLRALQSSRIRPSAVVINDISSGRHATPDRPHNPKLLTELLAPIRVLPLPNLGPHLIKPNQVKKVSRTLKKTITAVLSAVPI